MKAGGTTVQCSAVRTEGKRPAAAHGRVPVAVAELDLESRQQCSAWVEFNSLRQCRIGDKAWWHGRAHDAFQAAPGDCREQGNTGWRVAGAGNGNGNGRHRMHCTGHGETDVVEAAKATAGRDVAWRGDGMAWRGMARQAKASGRCATTMGFHGKGRDWPHSTARPGFSASRRSDATWHGTARHSSTGTLLSSAQRACGVPTGMHCIDA